MKTNNVATPSANASQKNACVHRSLHMPVGVDSSKKRKPKTIEFYNETKCGADQMARQYSVKTGIRRWPVAVILYL